MTTVQKIQRAVQKLQQEYIPKAKARRFRLGVQVFGLQEFSSLNAIGRKLSSNRWSGESRIRRLVKDRALTEQIQHILVQEALVGRSGYWYCSLDHSQFGPFCIAILAISNRKGRAIPIWCQVNVSEAGLIAPLLKALTLLLLELRTGAPALHLVLVMDRWFASDILFTLLTSHKAYFIARTKSDKRVQLPWDPSWYKIPILELSFLETDITYRSHRLRLIRSDIRPDMKDPEPWFLLTNLPEEITRRQVLNRYAERFEIEEVFKDIKWLQRLEWQRVRKPEVIRHLLLFVFLGWWLLWKTRDKTAETTNNRSNQKKQLSWFRLAWEHLQYQLQAPSLFLLT